MSERKVILRHRQVCDLCHHAISAGERAWMIRDDFWPQQVWFEHIRCPTGNAVPVLPQPDGNLKTRMAVVH